MAPITTTTAGISRQVIDDPSLISLLKRLRSIVIPMNDDNNNDEDDVVMADNDDDHRDEKTEGMIEALVKELVDIPRWRFQEQVRSFY